MSFFQLVTVSSDRLEEILVLDGRWRRDTVGRSTVLREVMYADRAVPGRVLVLAEYPSAEAAARNSELPETQVLSGRIAELSTEFGFTDLDLLEVLDDRRAELVAGLLEFLCTAKATDGLFTDELECDLNVPYGRVLLVGPDASATVLREDAPAGMVVEGHRWSATAEGFIVEAETRSVAHEGGPGTYSRMLIWATLDGTRISRLSVYCTGDWDAATEADNRAAAGG